MKQILAILTLIASLTFTSCEDFLTEEVRGQQNLDTYFQSVGSRVIHHRLLPGHHFRWLVEHQYGMVTFRNVQR